MLFSDLRESTTRLPRRWRGNVGKSIGGAVYAHQNYEKEVIPELVLLNAQKYLEGFKYNIVKYVPQTDTITFIQSPDFDSADEPMVGTALLVKPDGNTKAMNPSGDPWIYHHKWLWVKDDYTGFDVEESKQRSLKWMSLPNIDRSRIGKKSYWERNVVPQLG